MQEVDIAGVGTVEFPDEMSDAQIQQAIERDILKIPELRTAPTASGELTQSSSSPGQYLMGGAEGVLGKAAEMLFGAAPTAMRVGSQMAARTPLVGAALGAGGEYLAQSMEGGTGQRGVTESNPQALVSQGALGAFMPTAGRGFIPGALKGAGVGLVTTAVPKAIEERRLPTAGEAGFGALIGAVMGGGMGKLNDVLARQAERSTLATALSKDLGMEVSPTEYDVTAALALKAEQELQGNVLKEGRADLLGTMLTRQAPQGPPLPAGVEPMTQTSALLQRAQETITPSPAPEPSPTSSLLQMAQRTLTGESGSSNLFGDWARRIMAGEEPPDLAQLSYMDLLKQKVLAQQAGDTATANKIEQALATRVPPTAVAKQVTSWLGVKQAAQVMQNPSVASTAGMNVFGEAKLVTDAAIQQAAAFAQTTASKTDQRLYKQVADAFVNGELSSADVMNVLDTHQISLIDFVQQYKDTVRSSAQTLQRLSAFRQRLNSLTVDSPQAKEAADALNVMGGAVSPMEKMRWKGRSFIDAWRGLMTTQPKTTIRNIVTQTGASAVEAMDMMFAGNFRGAKNLAQMETQRFVDGMTHVGRFFQGLPGQTDRLDAVFAAFPKQAQQLNGMPVAEASLGKWVGLLNTLNSTQEKFFRRAAFEAHVKTWAERAGVDVATALAKPSMIPDEVIEEGTKRVLKMTFAATPESAFGKAYLKVFHEAPMLYALNPFPRFQANALRFLYEHSPLGLSRLVTRQLSAAEGTTGTITGAREILAQAMTGTALFASAAALRYSPLAGEHWYTVKHEGQDIDIRTNPQGTTQRDDLRPYSPFAGYLFSAELLKNFVLHGESRMNDQDAKVGLQAMALRGGAGYSLADIAFGNDPVSSVPGTLERVAGSLLSGFTVPLRVVKDFVSGVEFAQTGSSEEAKYRDVREHPILGPAAQNIPYASRLLPESPNYLVPGQAMQADYPFMGQFTGRNVSDLTPQEAEVARLGLSSKTLRPQTGVPAADRASARVMALPASSAVRGLMQSPGYQAMDREMQAGVTNQVIDRIRGASQLMAAPPGSALGMEVLKKRLKSSSTPKDIILRRMLGE
jgi:hypothetical protein